MPAEAYQVSMVPKSMVAVVVFLMEVLPFRPGRRTNCMWVKVEEHAILTALQVLCTFVATIVFMRDICSGGGGGGTALTQDSTIFLVAGGGGGGYPASTGGAGGGVSNLTKHQDYVEAACGGPARGRQVYLVGQSFGGRCAVHLALGGLEERKPPSATKPWVDKRPFPDEVKGMVAFGYPLFHAKQNRAAPLLELPASTRCALTAFLYFVRIIVCHPPPIEHPTL